MKMPYGVDIKAEQVAAVGQDKNVTWQYCTENEKRRYDMQKKKKVV